MTEADVIQFPLFRAAGPGRGVLASRLRDARKIRRLSQGELADQVGVSRQAVSAFERGDRQPEAATLQRIAGILVQPVSFFVTPDRASFGENSTRFYRRAGSDSIRRNEACDVLSSWLVQTAKYFDDILNYPAVDLPEFEPASGSRYSFAEIDRIAGDLRRHWGLGAGPISNVLALLESKGILICRYEMEGDQIDAFSFWNGSRPFIVLASEKRSGARRRFDLAHELGHLVLHRWIDQAEVQDKAALKLLEGEADKFAAAFLLPSSSFPNEVYTTKLDSFVYLKERWKVSIQSMIYRCRDLDIIDEDQFLALYKSISYRRWRGNEPLDDPGSIPVEQPRLLKRAFELVTKSAGKPAADVVNEIGLNPAWIEVFCGLDAGSLAPRDVSEVGPTLKR